jgi:hypothetical protein
VSGKFIVATTTWNSADVLEAFLSHNQKLGVEAVLAMDFQSDDDTAVILNSSRWRSFVRPVEFPGLPGIKPSNIMLGVAKAEFADRFCIFCDPDEFLACDSMDLAQVARAEEWDRFDLISVRRRNMTTLSSGAAQLQDFTERFLRVDTPHERTEDEIRGMRELESPWIFTNVMNKIVVKVSSAQRIEAGDHEAVVADGGARFNSRAAMLLHYPIRDYREFLDKIRRAEKDFLSNPHLPEDVAWHWRRWIRIWRQGKLPEEFAAQFIKDADLETLMGDGTIVVDKRVAALHSDLQSSNDSDFARESDADRVSAAAKTLR